MYDMPLLMDHTNKTQPEEKVSTIKTFLQSCFKLLSDPLSVKYLKNMLEICNTKVTQRCGPLRREFHTLVCFECVVCLMYMQHIS
jgi:hypothetical protein